MLTSKFVGSVSRRIYAEQCASLLCTRQFSKKSLRNGKCGASRELANHSLPSRCKEYRERLSQCPKALPKRPCSKNQSKETDIKCDVKVITEAYHSACNVVTARAKEIVKSVENDSRSIVKQLEEGLEVAKKNEAIHMQELFRTVQEQLQRLIALDATLGSTERKRALSLCDRIREAFVGLQRDAEPCAKQIKSTLEKIRCGVLTSGERAKILMFSCRRCITPQELERCVQESEKEALKLLDQTAENVISKLHEIRQLQTCVLKSRAQTTEEIIETYHEEATALAKYLERCAIAIEKFNK